MDLRILATFTAILTSSAFAEFQRPLDEQWVLSEDKAAFLKTLTPGTNDFYFYHALFQQQTGQTKQFRKTMQGWKSHYKSSDIPGPRATQLLNRQTLLDYEAGITGSDIALRKIFGLRQPKTNQDKSQRREFTSTLDPASISHAAFLERLDVNSDTKRIQAATPTQLLRLASRDKRWSKPNRDILLRRIDHAGLPRIEKLLLSNFKNSNPLPIAQIACAKNLSKSQLDFLAASEPSLLNDFTFVGLIIQSMLPEDTSQFLRDPQAHLDWLTELEAFTHPLPSAHNSFKAHVLHHKLRIASEMDRFPLDDFVRYLSLPRKNNIIWNSSVTSKQASINLNHNFYKYTKCEPIGDEILLINRYLDTHLANSATHTSLAQYFNAKYFHERVSRAQLLAGVSNDQLERPLSAAEYERLRDQKELNIASSTPKQWNHDSLVKLNVDLKNIDVLTLSIYALDSLRYAKETGKEIQSELDLSSLIPSSSRTINTKKSPFLRHRKVIELPELNDVGSWMIELHGNGQRATAMIHKGEIHHCVRDTGDGQEVFVSDFEGAPMEGVEIYVEGKMWTSDKNGTIHLPYSPFTSQSIMRLHLPSKDRENGITRIARLKRRKANTSMELACIAHPEQWLADQKATFYYKPSFLVNGKTGSIDRVQKSQVILRGTLREGQEVELAREFIKLSSHDFLPLSFIVPQNLTRLRLEATATLKPIAGRETPTVRATKQLVVTPAPLADNLAHHYFFQADDKWFLQCLGRNGEPWSGKTVTINLSHKDFKDSLSQQLVTDKNGTITLGRLKHITHIAVTKQRRLPAAKLNLTMNQVALALADYYPHGDSIECTLPDNSPLNQYDFSLRGAGADKKNYFDSLKLSGNTLRCEKLPVGKYILNTPYSAAHEFEVIDATQHSHWLTKRGLAVECPSKPPAQLKSVKQTQDKLTIQLDHSNHYTRIHLVASHFSEAISPYQPALPRALGQSHFSFGFIPSNYSNGGILSGEHQYILNRRAEGGSLGVMLERPAWHLRPWKTEVSESFLSEMEKGESGRGGARPSAMKRRFGKKGFKPNNEEFGSSPIDFLEQQALILSNLTPDSNGVFELNMAKLEGFMRVDVIVTHGQSAHSRRITLPKSKVKTIDLRLAKAFDSAKQLKAGETHATLKAGASVTINNVVDADWKAYSSLEDAYSYFYTHTKDQHHNEALRTIAPMLRWPKLTQAERLELLENAGSHELHLFIKNRDPKWFNEEVVPMLQNKRHKQFFDHYLLDHDLTEYTKPSIFHKLNLIEQSLLARRLKSQVIAEKLKADYLRVRPETEAETALFTSLLQQGFDSDLDTIKRSLAQHSAQRYMRNKLQSIVIPHVHFNNVTVDEALHILRNQARERDSLELDPMRKGVNVVVRTPTLTGPAANIEEFGGPARPGSKIIQSLELRDAPFEVILRQICDVTQLRYKIEDNTVVLLPATDFDDTEYYTRSFNVPPDFITLIHSGGSHGGDSPDPFADDSQSPATLGGSPSVKDLLVESGVVFPEGTTATFNRATSTLTIRNTANNLDIIEQLTSSLKCTAPHARHNEGLSLPNSALGRRQSGDDAFAGSFSDDPFAEESDTDYGARPLVDPSSIPYETKAYAESNYYKRQVSDGPLHITPNRFWVDVATWDGTSEFLSPHFAACRGNRHEAMIALALLDLPFEAIKPEIELEKSTMKITANQAMLLYYRDLKSTDTIDSNNGLLSSLRYFRSGDIFTEDDEGTVSENTITGAFQIQTPYEAHLTLTNPTGVAREVDILRQIPAGSIRLDTSDSISALRTTIPPHGSWQHIVKFYFPSAGEWSHYAPRIHQGADLVSKIEDRTLSVIESLPVEYFSSWDELLFEGSSDAILNALRTRPLHLMEISWLDDLMTDEAFYTPAIKILQERMVNTTLFVSQAIDHRDLATLSHFLGDPMHCSNQFGYYFKSESIDTTPYLMQKFEDIEWRPLINERTFPLASENRISNVKVWGNYLELLTQLAWKKELSCEEKLTLVYHLFLHDRNNEAITLMKNCSRENTDAKMQFDYLTCYIHFLNGEPSKAKKITQYWLESAKAPWNKRFSDIVRQLEHIENAALLKPHEDSQQAGQFWSASLSNGNTLRIEHQKMKEIAVQVYPVDLELLFSNSPFLSSHDANYKAIRPLQEFIVNLDQKKSITEFKLPESYQSGNRLLVIDDGIKEWLHPLQSARLRATINTASGMLQSISEGKPVPGCYVKIYALSDDGSVLFFKDGHTDLRGMFDYQSHNVHAPSTMKNFAIFISHPDLGSITKRIGDAAP